MSQQEPEDLIAICTECKNPQNDSYIGKSSFYAQGDSVPCQFCAGVTVITKVKNIKSALKSADQKRGLA